LQALADPRLDGLSHQADGFEVAEQIAAQDPLRQRRLAGADRQCTLWVRASSSAI
jgi:hypothetical protein